MRESRSATRRASAEGGIDGGIKSDLAKVDAHEITQEEYDEIPELTDEMLARADVYVDGRFVRMGPPGTPQWPITITLPNAVVEHFRACGPGWRARIDEILLDAVRHEQAAKAER